MQSVAWQTKKKMRLNGLASHRLNSKLITQNWDDFLRVAGSIKMGKVSRPN